LSATSRYQAIQTPTLSTILGHAKAATLGSDRDLIRHVPVEAIRSGASIATLIPPEVADTRGAFGLPVAYTTTPPVTTIIQRSPRYQLQIGGDTSDIPA
jgi:hypothetical protein